MKEIRAGMMYIVCPHCETTNVINTIIACTDETEYNLKKDFICPYCKLDVTVDVYIELDQEFRRIEVFYYKPRTWIKKKS